MRIQTIRYKCDRCGEMTDECYRVSAVSVKDDVETEWEQPFTGKDLCMKCALKLLNKLNDKPDNQLEETRITSIPRKGKYLSEAKTEEAVNMYREGFTTKEIANRLNVFLFVVVKKLREVMPEEFQEEEPEPEEQEAEDE